MKHAYLLTCLLLCLCACTGPPKPADYAGTAVRLTVQATLDREKDKELYTVIAALHDTIFSPYIAACFVMTPYLAFFEAAFGEKSYVENYEDLLKEPSCGQMGSFRPRQ
jgi:hypothetical protein